MGEKTKTMTEMRKKLRWEESVKERTKHRKVRMGERKESDRNNKIKKNRMRKGKIYK
jgi:hypothetical protein